MKSKRNTYNKLERALRACGNPNTASCDKSTACVHAAKRVILELRNDFDWRARCILAQATKVRADNLSRAMRCGGYEVPDLDGIRTRRRRRRR